MKIFLKSLKILIELVVFLAVGYSLIGAAYYFGWTMLLDGSALGNDTPSALQSVFYLDRWYPYIPSWNYLWTGGMPSFSLYPPMGMYITFFLHRLADLAIIPSARVYLFLSIALASVGVALLGRMLTKNWFVGVLAGIIMLLLPDTWIWATYSGFFAAASSVPVYAFGLAAFVWAMEVRNPVSIALAAFLYGLSWTFHPMAGMLATMTMFLLGWGYGVRDWGLKRSWKGILKAWGIAFLGACLFAWWIFPFFTREEVGGIGIAAKDMYRDTFAELIGFDPPAGSFVVGTFFSMGPIVLFLFGSLVVFVRKSILRWAFLACLAALFLMTAPGYAQPVVEKFNLIWAPTNVRAALVLRILGPIIAAYGAVSAARPLFWLVEKFFKKIKTNLAWKYTTEGICGAIGVLVVFLVVKNVVFIPKYFTDKDGGLYNANYTGYGPMRTWVVIKEENNQLFVVNPLTDKYEPLFKDPQTIITELPKIIEIAKEKNPARVNYKSALELAFEQSKLTEKDRIDIPPFKGEYAGSIGLYSQVAEIPTYMGTSLIQPMWGWQVDCTYWNKTCGPQQIEDLARWWGIKQVWLAEAQPPDTVARFNASPLFKFEKLTFNQPPSMIDYMWHLYHFEDATGLASVTNKPVVLVIGNNPPNNDVYDIVFRDLSKVDFGYKDAWSVRGKRFIDDYSLKELKQFEAIILYGYQYNNRQKAWDLLGKYVNDGGNLFVDTGWKWISQDWGKEEGNKPVEFDMPDILPVKKTIWTTVEGGWDLRLGSHPITEGVGLTEWGFPLWEGKPWGIASAKKEWLREGADILLEDHGQTLMAARSVGKGKVVWSGFDIWGHLVQYQANDERKMVQKMMVWLVGRQSQEQKLDFDRVNPDNIVIKYDQLEGQNKLMFKEVASSNWQAQLKDQSGRLTPLPIVKAGPSWKMVFLPGEVKKGEVIFSYHKNTVEYLGIIISIVSAVLIVVWFVMKILKKDSALIKRAQDFFNKKRSNIKKGWDSEEN